MNLQGGNRVKPTCILPRSLSCLVLLSLLVAVDCPAGEVGRGNVYSVIKVKFDGPTQGRDDVPARDIDLWVRFVHEGSGKSHKVLGFWDGDGKGGPEGNVFEVRFCPTRRGRWVLAEVYSNRPELNGQKQNDYVTALRSSHSGFWEVDAESPGGRWYRRSDGSHQYIVGNTHYSFLSETADGGDNGSDIASDVRKNAAYFKKLRFSVLADRYPHPEDKPFFDSKGNPSDDGNDSHRPNPTWFHNRVDLAVETAFEHDLIADLILAGPDTVEARSTLKAASNDGDAAPYLKYIAARYGSYPNVWLCLCNEHDIKKPHYTDKEVVRLGKLLLEALPYSTPVSIHRSQRDWAPELNSRPAWNDHVIVQRKLKNLADAADVIQVNHLAGNAAPVINDELSYQGAGDRHSEGDNIEAHLGALLGGGYASGSYKPTNKKGQYFWGNFSAREHTAADKLRWLRDQIDHYITFWKMQPIEPGTSIFSNTADAFRAMAWDGQEYVLGTNRARKGVRAKLPSGTWIVTSFDVLSKTRTVLSSDAQGRFVFDAPESRAVLFHFQRNTSFPAENWPRVAPHDAGMDVSLLEGARDYALTGGGSGNIVRHGKLVMAWGPPTKLYDLKSTTKSIGVTALGLALLDNKIKLTDRALKHQPKLGIAPDNAGITAANQASGWLDKITIHHLATQTAGFDKPGGYTKLLFEPGTKWSYSDGGPNWLAECVTLVYGTDVRDLMFERVFTPLGITQDDLTWRTNSYRAAKLNGIARREFGSGISANVDAMARIGYLYLRNGMWNSRQILTSDFVDTVRTSVKGVVGLPEANEGRHGNASDHYGLLWWNNADGTLEGVPRDAYWSWGLYDSLIVVIPSLDIVVSRAGASWKREWSGHYDVLRPFLEPIVKSVLSRHGAAPYPRSAVVKGLDWAPASTIIRKAVGSDNWPLTWADDGQMYTAYGDGWGFQPMTEEKLSLGLAVVSGPAENFAGKNIRSLSLEQKGGGRSGKKASGMLMVEGVLYMWVRNAGNSQLAWSTDRGKNWTWPDWKFETSFGCPTFLNFGKNYQGARDNYAYVYSHDSDSAYEASDATVLARVPKDRLRNRDAYEFFMQFDGGGQPIWVRDITKRGPVLVNPGKCYRTTASFWAAKGRYLLCQTQAAVEESSNGGFGIFDAPEPWGPWTTLFYAENWDADPGETVSLPTKWMSADGDVLSLVFSGEDSFSVRKAAVTVNSSPQPSRDSGK